MWRGGVGRVAVTQAAINPNRVKIYELVPNPDLRKPLSNPPLEEGDKGRSLV